MLATQTGAVTFVPDVLENEYALHAWFPPDNEEKRTALQTFFKETAVPPLILPKVNAWLAEAKVKYPSVEKWGIFGLCWGGKVRVLFNVEDPPKCLHLSNRSLSSVLQRELNSPSQAKFILGELKCSKDKERTVADSFKECTTEPTPKMQLFLTLSSPPRMSLLT